MLMFFKLFFNSEKYPSSQAGLEPTTFRSLVRRSNQGCISMWDMNIVCYVSSVVIQIKI